MTLKQVDQKPLLVWLAEKEMTVPDLAGKLGVYPATVYNWLDGTSKVLPKNRRACAKALKLRYEQILWRMREDD